MGRARGVDLRRVGSKNIGATNAFRELGARWGAIVFAADVLKGYLASLVPRVLVLVFASRLPESLLWPTLVAGFAAILGHVFSPWLGFKGGRGVATSLGVFLGIMPFPTLLAFLIWILLVSLSRRVSVGSIGAALAYPFLVRWLASGLPKGPVTLAASAVALLVIARHVPNIKRLLAGTEPPILGAPKEGKT